MADSIVQGLFGLSPNQVRQQQQVSQNAYADQLAQTAPRGYEGAAMMMGRAGQGLGNMLGGAMGMQNTQVVDAQKREQMGASLDLSTSQKALEAAQRYKDAGMYEQSAMLVERANQLRAAEQAAAFAANKDARDEKRLDFDQTAKYDLELQKLEDRRIAAEQASTDRNRSITEQAEARKEANSLRLQIAQMTNALGKDGNDIKRMIAEAKLSSKASAENGENVILDLTKPVGQKAATAHQEDLSQANTSTDIASNMKRVIKEIKKPENLKSLFGKGYSGVVTSQFNPDAKIKLQQLKNMLEGAGLQQLKSASGQSLGSMQVQEWDKMGKQIGAIDTTMSEEAASRELADIEATVERISNNMKREYATRWDKYPQLYKGAKKSDDTSVTSKPTSGGSEKWERVNGKLVRVN